MERSKAKKRRLLWLAVLGLLGLALALYFYDSRGPLETVRGEVLSTRTYPHDPPNEPAHTHIEAVIEIEGRSHTVREADGYETGDQATVVITRGRLTGRARVVDVGPASNRNR